jgi:DNA-binding FrmR family transcriptional regulator
MHTVREKQKLLSRINRLKGQLEAASKLIETEDECYKIMQLLSSARGALNGLMGDIIEDHIMEHIVEADNKASASEAGSEVTEILKSFWK